MMLNLAEEVFDARRWPFLPDLVRVYTFRLCLTNCVIKRSVTNDLSLKRTSGTAMHSGLKFQIFLKIPQVNQKIVH